MYHTEGDKKDEIIVDIKKVAGRAVYAQFYAPKTYMYKVKAVADYESEYCCKAKGIPKAKVTPKVFEEIK